MNDGPSPDTRLALLFRLVLIKKATPAQKEELKALMADPAHEKQVEELMHAAWEADEKAPGDHFSPEESETLLRRIIGSAAFERANENNLPVKRLWMRFAAAASVLLVLFGAGYFVTRSHTGGDIFADHTPEDISPGTDKAVLTLSDGRQIALDDAPTGVLVDGEKIKIFKPGEGALVYDVSGADSSEKPGAFHMISTPKGGRYRVTLPDGSRVWLNAASSLRYPAGFSHTARTVELTGEAYFEIASIASGTDSRRKVPFKVISGSQEVEVLGTHFNINSYTDEAAAKTTLLEGSIRVTRIGQQSGIQLRPGQQCLPRESGGFRLIENADIDDAVAWKDNLFSFKGSDIYSIMRQIARWYDIKVNYKGPIPPGHLTGFISRDVPLSRVLHMLEQISDLRFSVEGHSVTVSDTQQKQSTGINP